eukprot:CAMPEP_0206041924 /NCGR_PEP_ID=MMETSP1466-20131121/6247_1 /ASSEMBLY_ACC=CAM_ASM_001126 /TAXON_ID=44452 /ORGANISM="Pavlova gyrans, Strain CCMP608" /LENGTH=502 /DNA_ID=CAMNT_0053416629 /DNA_START=204 /DNA_END=1712 /DNA_ORIENTATION=+
MTTRTATAGSAKYRSKGKAQVDESLFASGDAAKARTRGDVAVVTQAQLAAALPVGRANAAVLSATDIERMRAGSRIKTWEEEKEEMRRAAEALAAKKAKANYRKQYMLAKEEERKKNVPLTDLEKADLAKREVVLSDAAIKLAEGLDDVKQMNQMAALAKTMTIRDMQLDEKKELEFRDLEEQRRLDEQLEAERLKALAMYDTREAKKAVDRRYGAEVLRMQMADRERQRLQQLELQDQEREAMVRQIALLKEEEARAQAERREQNRRLMEEVALANAEQIRTKNRLAAQDKEEERRIHLYNKAREQREREERHAEEKRRVEKEAEVERMRNAQQRMQDVASELDALRMKRADEEAERAWRRKEKAEAERLRAVHSQLSEAREAQKEEKERRMIEATMLDKEEFDYTLRVQAEQEARDAAALAAKKAAQLMYKEELQSQIVMNAVARKENRLQFLNEGRGAAADALHEKAKLEAIKTRKLSELKTAGVADKYLVDLQRKTFT